MHASALLSAYSGLWTSYLGFAHSLIGKIAISAWLLAFPLGGAIAYLGDKDQQNRSVGGLLRYLFPSELLGLRHPSYRIEIIYQMMRLLLVPLSHVLILFGTFATAVSVYSELGNILGSEVPRQLSVVPMMVVSFVFILIIDAAYFHVHYAQHKIQVLWELHKVHHSIERMLIGLSDHREHPLEQVSAHMMTAVIVGTAVGGICYVLNINVPEGLTASGTMYLVANALSCNHLRHSHIRLGYGWLERYVISPSQHHVHHAYEQQLWDKNFGWWLSIWDRMYGTCVYSRDARNSPIGLPEAYRSDYDSAWKLLVTPVIKIAGRFGTATSVYAAAVGSRLARVLPRRVHLPPSRVAANEAMPQ